MVDFSESRGPLDDFIISICELEWELRLPEDYRRFLATHNGGRPIPDAFRFKSGEGGSLVDGFFHIGLEKDYGLIQNRKSYKDRIPSDLLPIACDPFGNLICIATRGSNYGRVYFWDHEREADDGESADYSNVRLIADAFSGFLEGLYAMSSE